MCESYLPQGSLPEVAENLLHNISTLYDRAAVLMATANLAEGETKRRLGLVMGGLYEIRDDTVELLRQIVTDPELRAVEFDFGGKADSAHSHTC